MSKVASLLCLMALAAVISACDDVPENRCGNGVVEGYEECDGDDFYYLSCYHFLPEGAYSTWSTGEQRLRCNPDCTVDPSDCLYCGDGRVDEEFETCDSQNLGGHSCEEVWDGGGGLKCNFMCQLEWNECRTQWTAGDDPRESRIVQVTALPDGGYGALSVSMTSEPPTATTRILIFNEDLQFVNSFGVSPLPGNVKGAGLIVDGSGNFVVAATCSQGSGSTTGTDIWVGSLTPQGATLWDRVIGGEADETATHLAVGPQNTLLVSGYTDGDTASASSGGSDCLLLRLSADGTVLGQEQWGFPGDDRLRSVTSDGTALYVTGSSRSVDGLFTSGYVASLSRDGTLLWDDCWGTDSIDWGWDIAADLRGNIYITGTTMGAMEGFTYAGGFGDVVLLSFTDSGARRMVHQYGTMADDEGRGLCLSASGADIHITGYYGEPLQNNGLGGGNILHHWVTADGTEVKTTSWGTLMYEEGT
ncbi:SBBP repeat-containing protein, partial [Myxococcota bacterium]|nr:SBBP repeat-containing protein [Myxococcota bacterium]MBU1533805.1 SBBP repeat-containing protein [Myxococcota bacterium]